MADQIVRADSAMDAIIWLVLAAIWAIAQLINKIARSKKGLPPEPAAPPEVESPEQGFEDFLESLKKLGMIEQPPPLPPPPPTNVPMRPIPSPHGQRTTAAGARIRKIAPAKETGRRKQTVAPPAEPPLPQPTLMAPEHPEFHLAPVQQFKIVVPRMELLSTRSLKISLPAVSTRPPHARAHRYLGRALKGRDALRQAVVGRIVLGPPKAFG